MKRILPATQIVNKIKCPHCGSQAELLEGKSLVCKGIKKHCYDLSASGYVNLLPSGHSDSGDSKAAVRARKEFLDKGYYRPAADAICEVLCRYLPKNAFVIDAGCGEGYYSTLIAEKGFFVAGTDISKSAAESGAKRTAAMEMDNAFFTVGSVYALPFADESADCVVNIFAPCVEEEFCRVLKTGGILAVVYAGSTHLLGLKRTIYESTRENDGRADMPKNMRHLESIRVSFDITVEGQESIQSLFAMTPYYWRTSQKDSEKLKKTDRLDTAVDMIIALYIKEQERT